jgi:galactose-1-phosphate uridylyltransferase
LLIFQKHNPLTFDEHELGDYIETALRWFGEAHRRDASCTYPFLMWNCLEKAGASRVHGHAQLLLAKGVPYECPSRMFHAAETYRERCGRDYFGDLCKVHETLGLGVSEGSVCSFASLVPVKDKEIVVVSTDALKGNLTAVRAVYRALRCMIDKLGVTSFNCAVWFPPFGEESGRPTIVRVVDRGNIFKRPADMAAMELYGSSVIAADPYRVADALRGEG